MSVVDLSVVLASFEQRLEELDLGRINKKSQVEALNMVKRLGNPQAVPKTLAHLATWVAAPASRNRNQYRDKVRARVEDTIGVSFLFRIRGVEQRESRISAVDVEKRIRNTLTQVIWFGPQHFEVTYRDSLRGVVPIDDSYYLVTQRFQVKRDASLGMQ